jgi:hypothetical protein
MDDLKDWIKAILFIAIILFLIKECGGFEESSSAKATREAEERIDRAYTEYLRDQTYYDPSDREPPPWCETHPEDCITPWIPDDSPDVDSFSGDGCSNGCTYHKPGCDIKGNISYNTGERIYHVPGQEYYDKTKISPEYGERWFCTEQEAIANGWRKSKR